MSEQTTEPMALLLYESTPLLAQGLSADNHDKTNRPTNNKTKNLPMLIVSLMVVITGLVCLVYQRYNTLHAGGGSDDDGDERSVETFEPNYRAKLPDAQLNSFPGDFVWGVATSAYQIEGATEEDGRGPSVWDVFVTQPGVILDGANGNIADDHYHLWQQDVEIMDELGVTAYRFSISWSRILPNGRGEVNQKGIDFYDRLIDALLERGIQPWITLFHWDLPQALEDDFGGWMDSRTIDAFEEYSRVIFAHFATKVKHFITLNEPWTYSVLGHSTGLHAPGRKDHPDTEPYIVAHNFLLAHSRVFHMYKRDYGNGSIGIANCGDFRYGDAGERSMLFQWGWFTDPLIFGDYPTEMRDRVGDRLPTFTKHEAAKLMGSFDFLGLNYYEAMIATTPEKEAEYPGYWADMHADFRFVFLFGLNQSHCCFLLSSDDPSWRRNDMGWNVVPKGLYDYLNWIAERYGNPLVYITENGTAENEPTLESAVNDVNRQTYIRDHIQACAAAIQNGSNLMGYFVWSLLDNFEWSLGYEKRFGIVRVNYETLQRTPKGSATLYRNIVHLNSKSI